MDMNVEKNRIQAFVDEGNYHAAINIALSMLNECRRQSNQTTVDESLSVIEGVVKSLRDEFGSQN